MRKKIVLLFLMLLMITVKNSVCMNAITEISEEFRRNPDVLHEACYRGNPTTVIRLLTLAEKVHARDNHNRTPLHVAIGSNAAPTNIQYLIVQLLLNRGACATAQDNDDMTALHWAGHQGSIALAQLLLDRGALVNVQTKLGVTPLHYAASNGRAEFVQLLLEHRAQVDTQDHEGKTSLHYAAYWDKLGALKTLLFYHRSIPDCWHTSEIIPLNNIRSLKMKCLHALASWQLVPDLLDKLPGELKNDIEKSRKLIYMKNLLLMRTKQGETVRDRIKKNQLTNASAVFINHVLNAQSLDELKALGYSDVCSP